MIYPLPPLTPPLPPVAPLLTPPPHDDTPPLRRVPSVFSTLPPRSLSALSTSLTPSRPAPSPCRAAREQAHREALERQTAVWAHEAQNAGFVLSNAHAAALLSLSAHASSSSSSSSSSFSSVGGGALVAPMTTAAADVAEDDVDVEVMDDAVELVVRRSSLTEALGGTMGVSSSSSSSSSSSPSSSALSVPAPGGRRRRRRKFSVYRLLPRFFRRK